MWLGQAEEVSPSLLPARCTSYTLKAPLPGLVQLDEELSAYVTRHIGKPRKRSTQFGEFVDLVESGREDPLIVRASETHESLFVSEVP
jgi:hypothetical protein